ncbi:type II toxin-antitoxin system RelE/ParE family toxin [Shewanella sp. 5S214]|uniref:type II toxin-antitoxin system RelE/ParE family toxin n=1 Tax=Shewanella sp. 5S214 TaxID=3229999 RepID=UPI00352FB5B9
MSEKKFKFINDSAKKAFMDLPFEIRSQFGSDLNAVQQNEKPFSDFKDISSSVGAGAIELIENGSPAYRTVYCAKFMDTVYILHAFTKTTEGVDKQGMSTAKIRYKEMMSEVREMNKKIKQAK